MLDIRNIIDNAVEYKKSAKNRFLKDNIDTVVDLYLQRNDLIKKSEALKQRRNEIAKLSSSSSDSDNRDKYIIEGKSIKDELSLIDKNIQGLSDCLLREAMQVPNLFHPEAPIGKEEKDNLVLKKVGEIPQFDFEAQNHIDIAKNLDLIDFDKATNVAGPKFYYLKNEAVILELALIRFGLDILQKHKFDIYTTPDLAKIDMISKLGFNPRGPESNIYSLEEGELGLIGTAEITLGAYYADTILQASQLPIRMAGLSHCFRKEAGAAGQYSKGLYRVHQFTKLEMFVFCHPNDSESYHKDLLEIEEEIYKSLGIAYRVVDTCTGDLGAPAYRKFDIEAWLPGRGKGEYGEITSTSNCTDYQAKRLLIRAQDNAKNKFIPHMLNGTAIATSRTLLAILENYQNKHGEVEIPEVLIPYCGFNKITKK